MVPGAAPGVRLSAIEGAAASVTVTVTADEVTVAPDESVARAVSSVVPATVGVQAKVNGALVTGEPLAVPLAKKATWVMVEPAVGVAVAVTFVAVPVATVALLAGAVRTTEVDAAAVTVTAEEVTVVLFESSTRAVREKLPEVAGTQVTV